MVRTVAALLLASRAVSALIADPGCGIPCQSDVQCSQVASNCTWCIDSVCAAPPATCTGSPPPPANTSLPQYYIVGDSVSHGYSLTGGLVTSLLKDGLFEALPIDAGGGGQAGPTTRGVQCLRSWTGTNESRFDVVSYNFGLHDIEKAAWDAPTRVPISDYHSNLLKIAQLLRNRLPKAKQLFITSTPVSNSTALSPPRNESDVLQYNQQAKLAMATAGVPVLDLWAWMDTACGGDPYAECPAGCAEKAGGEQANCLQRKDNVHFWASGYHRAVEAITAAVKVLHYGTPCPAFLAAISTGLCNQSSVAV